MVTFYEPALIQDTIRAKSIKVNIWNENRRMGLSSKALTIKTFLDKRPHDPA